MQQDLISRLRAQASTLRAKSMPLADMIPTLQEAADALERLRADAERMSHTLSEASEFWAHYSSCNEGAQDDMAAERNEMLGKMSEAMLPAIDAARGA